MSVELQQLIELSTSIGSDSLLVQAAGGNTSIKLSDTLWIKASGTWLMEASRKPIMVPVRLADLLRAIERSDPQHDCHSRSA